MGIASTNINECNKLAEHAKKQLYDTAIIEEGDSLEDIDILVLIKNQETDIPKLINYLFLTKKKDKKFVYIIAKQLSESERWMYLQLGANGIITKSNSMEELFLIIKNNVIVNANNCKKNSETFPRIELVPNRLSVIFDGEKEVFITIKEYQLLKLLHHKKNQVVSYEEIGELLWKEASIEKKYRVANIIFHLKEKFPEEAKNSIQTIRTRGYMLNT